LLAWSSQNVKKETEIIPDNKQVCEE
jgi:hypothetical protein